MLTLTKWPRVVVVALMAALLALATSIWSIQPAFAHAYVLHTDPADGAVLASPPKQLQVWFSERVLLDLSTFKLEDSQGRQIGITPEHVDGAEQSPIIIGGRRGGPMAAAVFLDVPTLAHGSYRLSWRAVSANDLHPTVDDLVFGVQVSALPARHRVAASTPSMAEVVLRWLSFGGIAGTFGALLVALLLLPQGEMDQESDKEAAHQIGAGDLAPLHRPVGRRARRRLFALAVCSGAGGLVASVGLLLVQAGVAGTNVGGIASSTWFVLTETSYGARWGLSAALMVTLILISWYVGTARAASRQPTSGRVLLVVTLLVVGLLVLHTLQSHIAAAIDTSPLAIASATLHSLAASVWSGGLFALAIACVPLLRQGPEGATLAWGTLRRFGAVALPSVVALAITGLYAAGQLVATPDALLLSSYGQTLMFKVGLMLLVGLIGLANATALHPGVLQFGRFLGIPVGWRPFSSKYIGRTLLVEAAGVAVIVLAAAGLASNQPARGPAFDPPVTGVDQVAQNLSSSAGDLVVVLDVKPNRPGQNFLTLSVYNTRKPAPAPVTAVDARLLPPDGSAPIDERAVTLSGSQYQVAGGMISVEGAWSARVTVHRSNLPDATTTIAWTVFPPAQPGADRPPVISRQPLAPMTNIAALTLLVAFAIAGGWWGRRHFRPIRPDLIPATERISSSL